MTKCSCRSGRGTSGLLLKKPPASAKLVVSRPLRELRHSKMLLTSGTMVRREMPNSSVSCGAVDHLDHVGMVVQIPADARQVVHDGNAVGLQLRPGADAREHQELRRIVARRR